VPGERVGETADGLIYGVTSFLEKPALESARVCLAADWLWNTFVFVMALPTLLAPGRSMMSHVDQRLARIGASRIPSTRPGLSASLWLAPHLGLPRLLSPRNATRPGRVQAAACRTVSAKLSGPLALFPSLVPVPATSRTVATPGAAPCFNKRRCMQASLTDNAYDGAYDGAYEGPSG
jgi:hypothetical protein